MALGLNVVKVEPGSEEWLEPSQLPACVLDADYNVLGWNVDAVQAKVLQMRGAESPRARPWDLNADLTWLLIGANPKTMGWNDRQILQVNFPVKRPNCWNNGTRAFTAQLMSQFPHM